MLKSYFLETLKSVLGSSVSQYSVIKQELLYNLISYNSRADWLTIQQNEPKFTNFTRSH